MKPRGRSTNIQAGVTAATRAIKIVDKSYHAIPPLDDPCRSSVLTERKHAASKLQDAFAKLMLEVNTEIETAEAENAAHLAYIARCDTLSCAMLAKQVPRDVFAHSVIPFVGRVFYIKLDMSRVDIAYTLDHMPKNTLWSLCDSLKHGIVKHFPKHLVEETFHPMQKDRHSILCGRVKFALAQISAEMNRSYAACTRARAGYIRRFMRALEIYVSTPGKNRAK
jgi:hypothetical protein